MSSSASRPASLLPFVPCKIALCLAARATAFCLQNLILGALVLLRRFAVHGQTLPTQQRGSLAILAWRTWRKCTKSFLRSSRCACRLQDMLCMFFMANLTHMQGKFKRDQAP